MATMMKNMMIPLSGKADLDFVRGMIPHHQGAIDMAKVVLRFGQDSDVKAFAEGIVKAQQSEISEMRNWLSKTNEASLSSSIESLTANEQAMTVMMKNMIVPYADNVDFDFINGMVPHHHVAVDMAKVALIFSKDPVLRKLANEIVSTQKGEIAFMKNWLSKNPK
jgi:uncharacterized protein (DUF305 family)